MGDFPREADGRRIFTAGFTRVGCASNSMAMPMGEVTGRPFVHGAHESHPGRSGRLAGSQTMSQEFPCVGSRPTPGPAIRPRPPGSSGESISVIAGARFEPATQLQTIRNPLNWENQGLAHQRANPVGATTKSRAPAAPPPA
jgi:hypothetical protein